MTHQDETITEVIHILDAGLPLCGFTQDIPRDWPEGHRWIGRKEVDGYQSPPCCPRCFLSPRRK